MTTSNKATPGVVRRDPLIKKGGKVPTGSTGSANPRPPSGGSKPSGSAQPSRQGR